MTSRAPFHPVERCCSLLVRAPCGEVQLHGMRTTSAILGIEHILMHYLSVLLCGDAV